LLNDTNHCLEEGISMLSEIKTYETKIGLGEQVTDEDKKNHDKNQSICKANIQLANECIWMVKEISNWAKESFNNDVFTSRMASSLNFVLNKIVGPHCIELKVNKPSKYAFSPIKLLADLSVIY
jgi:ubiquitin conjugation factor E4 B